MTEQRSYVVLVDDDPAFRELLGTVLDRAGYETVAVSSAEEALIVIDEQRPDVVVTDVGLPGVSGYELCRQIKDRGDEIGVMMISGQRMEPFDRAAGILLGADDYMVKPVDPGELVARVWRLARRSNVDHLPSTDDARSTSCRRASARCSTYSRAARTRRKLPMPSSSARRPLAPTSSAF